LHIGFTDGSQNADGPKIRGSHFVSDMIRN
jgi:hypothetical protein